MGGGEFMLWVSEAERGTEGIVICGGPPTLSYRDSESMGLCTMTFFLAFFAVVLSSAITVMSTEHFQWLII